MGIIKIYAFRMISYLYVSIVGRSGAVPLEKSVTLNWSPSILFSNILNINPFNCPESPDVYCTDTYTPYN